VASRNPKYIDFGSQQVRVKFAESDLSDYDSVLRTIDGASIAILCGGPFQRMPFSLLRACIEKKISYIDIADDRSFVDGAHKLAADAQQAGIAAFIGCSVVPGLTSLLTQFRRTTSGRYRKCGYRNFPGHQTSARTSFIRVPLDHGWRADRKRFRSRVEQTTNG
jgi:short subunit dehydrogenase-like uncharacterized protein